MSQNEFAPVTPGEMLKEEFLAEYGLSQNQLAKAVGISPNRIAEIVNNRRRITADTALRLSLYFGNSPEFWLNLQTHPRMPSGSKRCELRERPDLLIASHALAFADQRLHFVRNSIDILCLQRSGNEDHSGNLGRPLPPGQVGGGTTRPQAQAPGRAGLAARPRSAAPDGQTPQPRRADKGGQWDHRLRCGRPRIQPRASQRVWRSCRPPSLIPSAVSRHRTFDTIGHRVHRRERRRAGRAVAQAPAEKRVGRWRSDQK